MVRAVSCPALMKRLGELIENGATADQVANDLVANVERRANRACRIGELELRKQEKLPPYELAAIFRQWLAVLEGKLEPAVYFAGSGVALDLRVRDRVAVIVEGPRRDDVGVLSDRGGVRIGA